MKASNDIHLRAQTRAKEAANTIFRKTPDIQKSDRSRELEYGILTSLFTTHQKFIRGFPEGVRNTHELFFGNRLHYIIAWVEL